MGSAATQGRAWTAARVRPRACPDPLEGKNLTRRVACRRHILRPLPEPATSSGRVGVTALRGSVLAQTLPGMCGTVS